MRLTLLPVNREELDVKVPVDPVRHQNKNGRPMTCRK
jgi:hypothetical protein